MTLGSVGVDGFFLLSGYLIVMSWISRPKLGTFLQKRMLRILPGYFVAAILSTIVVGLAAPGVPDWFRHFPYKFYLSSILSLNFPEANPVYPGTNYGSINGALWTIAYEFRCYLIVAIAGLLGVYRRTWIWLALTVVTLLGFFFQAKLAPYAWPRGTFIVGKLLPDLRLVSTFFVGGCFYLFRDRIRLRPAYAGIAFLLLVVADLFARTQFEVFFVLCFGYILFFAGARYGSRLPWMQHVPDISYGTYLYGWPAICLLLWYRRPAPLLLFLLSSVASIALGFLSWHVVESPMLKLKRRPAAPISSADELTSNLAPSQ